MKSCPQCDSSEFDSAGICLVCGYRTPQEPPGPPSQHRGAEVTVQGMIEMDSPGKTEDEDQFHEQPAWRQELSRRLHEIKQKRDSEGSPHTTAPLPFVSPACSDPARERDATTGAPIRIPRKTQPRAAAPKAAQPPPAAAPREEPEVPVRPVAPMPEAHEPESVKAETASPAQDTPETRSLQELIDNMVSRMPDHERQEPDTRDILLGPEPAPEVPVDRLILLSRTFSGLVDLLVVIISASAIIFAVDIFEGIEIFDTVSFFHYLALLAATFFVYSVFFLGTGNQTIGMMITELKLYGIRSARPGLVQVLARSAAYLAGTVCGGLGLIWGLFDRRAMCLHDRLSGTRVERLPYI